MYNRFVVILVASDVSTEYQVAQKWENRFTNCFLLSNDANITGRSAESVLSNLIILYI